MIINKGTKVDATQLENRVQDYLGKLCVDLPHRHVGSRENQIATDFFADTVAEFGFGVEQPQFECIDWTADIHANLQAGGETFQPFVGPYSLSYSGSAPLVEAASIEALETIDITGKLLLMHGELVQEQLMPKNFPFYNPEHHQQIYGLLEQKQPAAIVAATGRNPELAGAWYPFPLFEDGDFDIPSVYMTDVEGERLLKHVDTQATLSFQSQRIPSTGCNVIATKGANSAPRLVFCAHIDSKQSTPGALDNGTGVVILLLLAELLTDYAGRTRIEIVAINGEDYYGANGEIEYIKANQGKFDDILLAVNMDLAGHKASHTIYSLFGCPEPMNQKLHTIFGQTHNFAEGPEWYQSDHSIFIQNGRPAVAIASSDFMELSTEITHTDKDVPALVDNRKLVEIAHSLRDIVLTPD